MRQSTWSTSTRPLTPTATTTSIFRDESGNATDAQLLAFEDTWHWGPSAEATYAYLTNTARHEGRVPDKVSTIIAALRAGIGENQMMADVCKAGVEGPRR